MLPERSIQRRGETVRFGRVTIHRLGNGHNRPGRVRLSSWEGDGHLGRKPLDELNLARKFRREGRTGMGHWSGKMRGMLNASPLDPIGQPQRHCSLAKRVTERTIEIAVQHKIGSHGGS